MKKTVLVTGASSGIGEATAKVFAANGWRVIATMRQPAAGTELDAFEEVLITRLDVEDRRSIEESIAQGIARFGKIDLLINDAGFGVLGLFEATSRAKIREQFEINVFGVMDVTRAILPHFRKNRGGLIVNISSGRASSPFRWHPLIAPANSRWRVSRRHWLTNSRLRISESSW